MSRLDSFIRRVTAQRSVLDHVCAMASALDGPVLELGLGNGRTYDHLRERLPGRRIVCFDRALAAHARSRPPVADLVLGDIETTLAGFSGAGAALIHADIETAYAEIDAATARWLPPLAAAALRPGGLVASGLALAHPALAPLPAPPDVPADRYFLYRKV